MALRFFADHCISKFIIESLQKDGHHVFRLKDHLPVQSSDAMVIARAQELDALLLSLNATSLISWPIRRGFKGIIALQVRDRPERPWNSPFFYRPS